MSLENWSPLFSSILDSSVWCPDKDVRLLWITMLAKKDADGVVMAALPGLARAAIMSVEECGKALVVLESPDPHSRTSAFEGRRVEKVEGGWKVLNHEKYRDYVQVFNKRKKWAEAQQRKRLKAKDKDKAKADTSGFAEVHGEHTRNGDKPMDEGDPTF